MGAKSRFIGARFEPEQQRKLLVLSLTSGEPGNMSAALRMLVQQAPMPSAKEIDGAGGKVGRCLPEPEVQHA